MDKSWRNNFLTVNDVVQLDEVYGIFTKLDLSNLPPDQQRDLKNVKGAIAACVEAGDNRLNPIDHTLNEIVTHRFLIRGPTIPLRNDLLTIKSFIENYRNPNSTAGLPERLCEIARHPVLAKLTSSLKSADQEQAKGR